MNKAANLVELLRYRAAHQPEHIAYTFLVDGETETVHLTYEVLDQQARIIGAYLQEITAVGERVLLLYRPSLAYIAGFMGCLYAGAIAVPAFPPRLNRPVTRLQTIVSDAQARFVLTTEDILSTLKKRLAHTPDLAALHWVATDTLADDLATTWQEPPLTDDSLAFLQYTSGSTALPKGIMVSHDNLMHNLAVIYHAFRQSSASRVVSWLPPYHDMGLIGGILQPLYSGGADFLMSPTAFLQKPIRWLQAISRHRATTSGGPNFAYTLCLERTTPEQRATLDLSRWEVAFNGAEPIHAETLAQFAAAFAPYGFRQAAFYPCYGLAEATLFVSGAKKEAAPVVYAANKASLSRHRVAAATPGAEAQKLVSCGQVAVEQRVVIAHPQQMTLCAADEIGEIWVAGASVTRGYLHKPEETKLAFQAYLADTGEGPFLRTGDLGFLHEGDLFITGRLKDLIIIRGRNYYPQDIEHVVEQSHPALLPAGNAAFSVTVANQERLVIVQELKRRFVRNLDKQAVLDAIRQAVAESFELQVYAIVLVKPGGVPRTSSGKTQRRHCRAQFLAEELKRVAEWRGALPASSQEDATPFRSQAIGAARLPDADAIKAWLVDKIAHITGVAAVEIDPRRPFTNYGLDSVQAVFIAGELGQWLGDSLAPTLAWDYPSIEQLASHLAGETTGREPSPTPKSVSSPEPIAVIGLGCRFPGASTPQAFWQMLCAGTDAITEVPPSRRDLFAPYAGPQWGGFLTEIDQFDPQFFGISPHEAARMDPQQRLLLEVAWETLEDAGQVVNHLAGTDTGVFIGISGNEYSQFQFSNPGLIDAYAATGNALSMAANRISYVFGFRGPSLAVDTACSSSLVAIHLACRSLWHYECSLALAGGANLILSPGVTINFVEAGLIALDGRCKTFDARANGFVRGEGVGLVALKPLAQAVRDGDPIYALIRGSAINQDGRTNGLMAPNQRAQESVINAALRQAGIAPGQIQYVEAHGTGTVLGDPIEAKALGTVLSDGRSSKDACLIGSVKTNIGHLEAAAGVAGFIKTVLALHHRTIPPTLHFETPNPYIPFTELGLRVQQTVEPWPETPGSPLAGVSSFGFGGTNAHVVLAGAPPPPS